MIRPNLAEAEWNREGYPQMAQISQMWGRGTGTQEAELFYLLLRQGYGGQARAFGLGWLTKGGTD